LWQPGCRCHADPSQPHGPYYQWTAKVAGKTVTRWLSEHQASRYEQWIGNGRNSVIIAYMRQATELLLQQAADT
jgi:hypothetical protein